jgi:hypothetical protein
MTPLLERRERQALDSGDRTLGILDALGVEHHFVFFCGRASFFEDQTTFEFHIMESMLRDIPYSYLKSPAHNGDAPGKIRTFATRNLQTPTRALFKRDVHRVPGSNHRKSVARLNGRVLTLRRSHRQASTVEAAPTTNS